VERPPGSDPPATAFEGGRRAALAYVLRREHLRRTVRIALVVGILLTAVNQLDVMRTATPPRSPGSSAA
jgi:hypothetical protein